MESVDNIYFTYILNFVCIFNEWFLFYVGKS